MEDRWFWIIVFKFNRSQNHCHQLFFHIQTEFFVYQKICKLFTKRRKNKKFSIVFFFNLKLFLNHFYFELFWKILIKLWFVKKCIWTEFEILHGVPFPIVNNLTRYFVIFISNLTTTFYNKTFNFFSHCLSIFARWNFVWYHEALNLLDCVRVEKHSNKLQNQNYSIFNRIFWCCIKITKPTCWKCCAYKIHCAYIKIAVICELYIFSQRHPWFWKISMSTKHDLSASQ